MRALLTRVNVAASVGDEAVVGACVLVGGDLRQNPAPRPADSRARIHDLCRYDLRYRMPRRTDGSFAQEVGPLPTVGIGPRKSTERLPRSPSCPTVDIVPRRGRRRRRASGAPNVHRGPEEDPPHGGVAGAESTFRCFACFASGHYGQRAGGQASCEEGQRGEG